jgi:hypothetical protein
VTAGSGTARILELYAEVQSLPWLDRTAGFQATMRELLTCFSQLDQTVLPQETATVFSMVLRRIGRRESLQRDDFLLEDLRSLVVIVRQFQTALERTLPFQTKPERPHITVFISHSSKDKAVVRGIVDLIQSGLKIPGEEIRCTSLEGHRLPIGAHTEIQLREELIEAELFIGLVTPASVQSLYVMFELGARWGRSMHIAPLLACGFDSGRLKDPLRQLNTLSCDDKDQLIQLVDDLGKTSGRKAGAPQTYFRYIEQVFADSQSGLRVKTRARVR